MGRNQSSVRCTTPREVPMERLGLVPEIEHLRIELAEGSQ